MAIELETSASAVEDPSRHAPVTAPERVHVLAARRAASASGAWVRRVLIGIVMLWFGALILAPTVALTRAAFAGGAADFLAALASPEAVRAMGLTLGITLAATVVNTVFGVAFAVVLVRHRFWGRTLLDGLIDLPFAISPVVAGLMLMMLYGPRGWLGGALDAVHLPVVYHWPGMVLATMFVTVPFVVREVVPVLKEFGVDQEEVAYTLGAGQWTTFRRVTFPSIRWGLAYGITLTVARSLGEFGALLVVSGNILNRTQTATLYVHDAIESFHPERAYAMSLVLAFVSFVLLVGMESLRRRVELREREGGSMSGPV